MDTGPAQQVTSRYLRLGLQTCAARNWPDPTVAPGNEVARLRAVSVQDERGDVRESLDIRRPVIIELEFDVLIPGYVIVPNVNLTDEQGICIFAAVDLDATWHRRPRPVGRYVTRAQVPGNFFSEGTVVLRALLSTFDPYQIHADAPGAVAFHVTDVLDGGSARGDYAGPMPGVVRPALTWTNLCWEYHP